MMSTVNDDGRIVLVEQAAQLVVSSLALEEWCWQGVKYQSEELLFTALAIKAETILREVQKGTPAHQCEASHFDA